MSAGDVLIALAETAVVLWFEDERLRFRAPIGAVTEELRARVVACRPALIVLLRAGAMRPREVADWSQDDRLERLEREGILEFEGGLDHEVAERESERLARLEHVRAFVARNAVVTPDAAVATARLGSGPYRRP